MRHVRAYRFLISVSGPRLREVNACDGVFAGDGRLRKDTLRLLRAGRCLGAAVCLFDREGLLGTLYAGSGGQSGPVLPGTWFRLASVSKMLTASLAVGLAADGRLRLEEDIGACLGHRIRAAGFPDTPLTLDMLLCHTAAVRDTDLLSLAEKGKPLEEALRAMRFTGKEPGTAFAYSNEGAALAGAVLEAATGEDLDTLFEREWGVPGTYFPSRLPAGTPLCDAVRLLPKRRTAYSGRARVEAAAEKPGADPERHYGRAHGSLCMKITDLAEAVRRLMTLDRYSAMRVPSVPFGARDPSITEGKGLFIVEGEDIPGGRVLGHQGLAYGAAHGAFYRPDTGKGFVLLTSGCSLAREYVLTDLNRAAIKMFLEEPKD